MIKIISYNINGVRAALNKGLLNWIKTENPDVLCFQEIKAQTHQFDTKLFEDAGYHHFWFPAQKKGYSGTAILSKEKPIHVEYGSGFAPSDIEGRTLRADFANVSVMSIYAPSGSSGPDRQTFKMEWLKFFNTHIKALKTTHPNLVLVGDYNICHQEIDIHNPIANANSSGFLPEERQWFSEFLDNGLVDSFRHLNKEPKQYTWWSYRGGARRRNAGWRIDYGLLAKNLVPQLEEARILKDVVHSDHCPVTLKLKC